MSSPGEGELPEAPARGRRHPAVLVVAAILALEGFALAVAAGWVLVELFIEVPLSYATAIAMLVLTALASVWLFVLTVGMLRGRSWARGGALFWQLLQIAVAVGSFQGAFARADIGWWLLVPALLVIVLLFSKPVIAWTPRR